MNKYAMLTLVLLIQLSLSNVILTSPTTLTYQDVLNNFDSPIVYSLSKDKKKTQGLKLQDAKPTQFVTDKKDEMNEATQSTQPAIDYYKDLLSKLGKQTNSNDVYTPNVIASRNSGQSNSEANPNVIAQPPPGLIIPETKPNLFTQSLDFVYQSNKNNPKASIVAYIPKKGKYSLKFDLFIRSSIKVDAYTKITMTIKANKNVTNLNVLPGISKQVATFQSISGINEISIRLKVETKYKVFIQAFIQNIEVAEVK